MTPPLSPDDDDGASSVGRDVRLAFGCLCLAVLLYLAIIAEQNPTPLTTRDLILYGFLLVAGMLLIAPKRFMQLVGMLRDKIPGLGPKS